MKAIITVVGGDKVGIIAKVSAYLAARSINIVDITQTILSGNFVMMMMVDFENASVDIDSARKELTAEAESLGVELNLMNEKVFTEMHRI
ncbi:MAG: ACT domain-containing protein [Treponema sp.]|nr:ACT domain-containing protein [Treponema sp.]